MQIRFETQVAETLSIHEAIFLGWLQHSYNHAPIKTDELEALFAFWRDEVLYKVLLKLEERQILQVKRNQQDYCLFQINPKAYQAHTGLTLPTSAVRPAGDALLDDNLKKHLQRFQGTDSVLHNKLSQLVRSQSQVMLNYAQEEGLSAQAAQASLDKFLHYVAANPDRFWNSDLEAYWRFWISNSKDKQTAHSGLGKRAAIEKSVEHAAHNWLKRKTEDAQRYASVKITHE
ncbi:MAG: hypothetical protein ACP5D0_09095 [Hydrogenovibrio sp.]